MIKKIALLLAVFGLLGLNAVASTLASDNANNSPYEPGDTWANGQNGGFGFQPWSFTGAANFFIGSSTGNGGGGGTGIDTNGHAWGIFASGGAFPTAYRPFNGALSVGQTFSLQMDNGFIDNSAYVGFQLGDGQGNIPFSFEFFGGQNNYSYDIGNNRFDTGVPFTTSGLSIALTLGASNAFSLAITPIGGATTTINGTLGSSNLVQVALFNLSAGAGSSHDVFFNNLAIVPEPSSLALIALSAAFGGSYLWRRRR